MKTVVVTGSNGFIGKHLVEALRRCADYRVITIARDASAECRESGLREADIIYHLAGVNRPKDPAEFEIGNGVLTETICSSLRSVARTPLFVLASSTQAAQENPYGLSKRRAEDVLTRWAADTGGRAVIFRLTNVFGKWCRPNYNSVVATFCYNIAHNLPIQVHEPTRPLDLVYIDDVMNSFLSVDESTVAPGTVIFGETSESQKVTLGELARLIQAFKNSRETLELPSFADEFTRRLYGTYLSYIDGAEFGYALDQKTDNRGSLAEFIKQPHFGQLFVSRTKPGVTRGNHYHHTKTEKFLVVEGDAVIRFRPVLGGNLIEHRVNGAQFRVLDIPPGYSHSIENVGAGELVTLFWASEVFNPQVPDVYSKPVL